MGGVRSFIRPMLDADQAFAAMFGRRRLAWAGVSTVSGQVQHRRAARDRHENPRFAALPARPATESPVQGSAFGALGTPWYAICRLIRSASGSPPLASREINVTNRDQKTMKPPNGRSRLGVITESSNRPAAHQPAAALPSLSLTAALIKSATP